MTPSRSFHQVMAFLIFIVCLLGFLPSCVHSDPSDDLAQSSEQANSSTLNSESDTASLTESAITPERQAELIALVEEWVQTRDDSLIYQVQDEAELQFVGMVLQHLQEASDEPRPPPSYLPVCSGYWGTQARLSASPAKAESVSYGSHWYAYYWSPNCYMNAPADDCGTDHNDYMISFWMGPDYTLLEGYYMSDSSDYYTYWNLFYHSGASYRVYTSTAYGPRYGNAYVCLSDSLDPSSLRFGRM